MQNSAGFRHGVGTAGSLAGSSAPGWKPSAVYRPRLAMNRTREGMFPKSRSPWSIDTGQSCFSRPSAVQRALRHGLGKQYVECGSITGKLFNGPVQLMHQHADQSQPQRFGTEEIDALRKANAVVRYGKFNFVFISR